MLFFFNRWRLQIGQFPNTANVPLGYWNINQSHRVK